jgi:hypothetical protein
VRPWWLRWRKQNPGNPSLEILAREGAIAVVATGRAGGPVLRSPGHPIFKALSAIRLAGKNLPARGLPAVPGPSGSPPKITILSKSTQAWVFNAAHEVVVLKTAAVNPLGGPVGPIPVGEAPLDELAAAASAGLPYADEVMAMVAGSAYVPGATFGGAFRALARKLLARWPILFLDPLAPAIRAIGAPLLEQAVARAPELNAALLERNAELAGRRYRFPGARRSRQLAAVFARRRPPHTVEG